PVLIDRFLEDAIEVDVDAISDGRNVVVAGIMEHIEEAGIHSGDSACSLPPCSLDEKTIKEIKDITMKIAKELGVVGLMNVQYAVKNGHVYVLEVNPRASRTVPFVSKSIGKPLAMLASKIMVGYTLENLNFIEEIIPPYVSVKEVVFPFDKFPEVDVILGPEMKSTGEVMGIDFEFGHAYGKAQISAMGRIPKIGEGKIFISVKDKDKIHIVDIAKELVELGFEVIATRGTALFLKNKGINVGIINKLHEGRPNVLDLIKNGEICYIINTVADKKSQKDSLYIRRGAINYKIPYSTTIAGAKAMVEAIKSAMKKPFSVMTIQEYHSLLK
ncbi:MAG: ATP-grasp domain-containing protein, partial [Thermosulfidibacteraceae bacterium]